MLLVVADCGRGVEGGSISSEALRSLAKFSSVNGKGSEDAYES